MVLAAMIKDLHARPIAAVLFDIGGPIDTEILFERECDRLIAEAFAVHGFPVAAEAVAAASDVAVTDRAPNADIAMIEHLARGDGHLARAVLERFRRDIGQFDLFEMRAGIDEVLRWLQTRGLKLGVVANQPQRKIVVMQRAGLTTYFTDLQMSEGIGLRKPDPAIFVHVCRTLGVKPAQCIMVGDRIDNDIAPAKRLGMATIRLRTGRHRDQEALSADDEADFTVEDCASLRDALETLLDGAGKV